MPANDEGFPILPPLDGGITFTRGYTPEDLAKVAAITKAAGKAMDMAVYKGVKPATDLLAGMTRGKIIDTFCDGSSGTKALEVKIFNRFMDAFALWKERQLKYGPGNIAMTGAAGVMVRLADKVARLKRVYLDGGRKDFDDESLVDTWLDVINYGAIGLVCEQHEWPGLERNQRMGTE
jgi:hypothetical protein